MLLDLAHKGTIEPHVKGVFLLLLGRNKLKVAAKRRSETTRINGMAGVVYPKAPNEKVPMMAPTRAISKCIPMAVDLKLKKERKDKHFLLPPVQTIIHQQSHTLWLEA